MLGGGISMLWRDSYPAPMDCALAVTLAAPQSPEPGEYVIDVRALSRDKTQDAVFELSIALTVTQETPREDVPGTLSFVLPLANEGIPGPGHYILEVIFQGESVTELPFQAVLAS